MNNDIMFIKPDENREQALPFFCIVLIAPDKLDITSVGEERASLLLS